MGTSAAAGTGMRLMGQLAPVVVFAACGLVVIEDSWILCKEVLDFGLTCLVLQAPGWVFRPGGARRRWALGAGAVLAFAAVFKMVFLVLYGSRITPGALFVVWETNLTEAEGFWRTQLRGWGWGWLSLWIGLVWLVAVTERRAAEADPWPRGWSLWGRGLAVGLLVAVAATGVLTKLRSHNFFWVGGRAIREYTDARRKFTENLAQPLAPGITVTTAAPHEGILVLVIGESLSARHMGLLGYPRNTTPRLEAIRDELLVFSDVISPHTHTIASLNKILTFSNYEDPSALTLGSIVQLANAAGYRTVWISNQAPLGFNETLVTVMAQAAAERHFVGAHSSRRVVRDEAVLPVLAEHLGRPEPRLAVFVHLMGAHTPYEDRVPRGWSDRPWPDAPRTPFPSPRSHELINAYDHAVRYTDWIVRSIIEQVRSTGRPGLVVFLSDHGEEVFQEQETFGHNELDPTRPMYEVPLVVWASEARRRADPRWDERTVDLARPYLLDDFTHTWADFAGWSGPWFDPTRSIWHPEFRPRARLVGEGRDYDAP